MDAAKPEGQMLWAAPLSAQGRVSPILECLNQG